MTVRRPVLRYHGGKWMLAPWIIGFFPRHRVYTEPFAGGGAVLLRKPRAQLVEVLNDLDREVVNVFEVLRDGLKAAALADLLRCTPFARAEFELSYLQSSDPVEQARRTVVRAFMGFGSDSASGATTGFRANGAHPAKDWGNYPDAIAAFTARLRAVVVECRPAVEIIKQHDEPTTLHYCDPPYVTGTRSAAVTRTSKGYRHEMTDEDHRALAQVLRASAGMVVLSGYACDLYDRELFPDWERHEYETRADGGLKRTEVVWINPACSRALASTPRPSLQMFAEAAA